ncbi:hypothetical protein THAOC_30789 [Thalassiosira oceanica]|uniref:BTB domain-containing protein n=1 Tax=Thalassiosira oceanica TaxID=159749 RepID=K0RDC3_THAOC|nr:hypothetical protein THAOC_30789 [Thalassiosira oceanica]|eukprot:EJK50264.1 hypothetical protein THAOC_30789 [Thalassiosira oceanica]
MNAADAAANGSTQLIHLAGSAQTLRESVSEKLRNQQVRTVLVAFHEFSRIANYAEHASEVFRAFGQEWSIWIVKEDRGGLALYIRLKDAGSLDGTMTVRVEVGTYHPNKANMGRLGLQSTVANFKQHIALAQCFRVRPGIELVDGALIFKVVMYADQPPQNASVSDEYIPTNPFVSNVLKEYGNEETSDVAIEVGGETQETGTGRRKRAKTDSTTFHAHQFVLRCNAPTLAEMCKPGDEATPIRIGNVSPETFKHLLYYCYGGKISDEDLQENAREIIDAADRFGVANLKLEAEARLVRKETFTVDNILDNLLYADSKNCALLLEKAMDFVVKKKDEIIGKISLDDLPGTMVMDVLTAISQAQREGKNGDDDIDFMRVSELRRRLHEKGLCVDGSRKAMIALLKENSRESSAGE